MPTQPIDVALHKTTQERYLNYAMSVITSRALPDVRDGLKPVQRRILYAMYTNLRLTHDARFRKSAAIVGEVMGKYHPHGDQSIYDAMVRMAQNFSLRYPLVDGHGNFGSVDGDSAAAMRYTEARMMPLASELLDEIKKQTVPYRPNYDGTVQEPVVLPAQVPNLLINGATGIAVGMATNIPPHHLGEVVDALIALIDSPSLTIDDIVGEIIQGPDFPTGGVLLNSREELREIYHQGSGTLVTRAQWEVERDGARRFIVVTAIPYYVNKATLIEKIAEHIIQGKLPQVVDVRDESTADVRVVLELKRGASADVAMAYLFKHTPLEDRFHVNLTCLVPSENPDVAQPAKVDLKMMLRYFLDFRMEVVTRRIEHELAQLLRRIHILEGFEAIFGDLDEAIRIIRASEGKADAAKKLMAYFGIDAEQTEAILETKLYRLAKLEIELIRAELAEKRAEAARLQGLLGSEARRWDLIRRELVAIRGAYGDARRTLVDAPVKELEYSEEAYIIAERCWMMVSRQGRIKRQKSYTDLSTIRVREGDEMGWVLPGSTRDAVIFFTNMGRGYTMRIDDVPSTTGYGDPVQASFDFADGERVVGVVTTDARVLRKMTPDQPSLVGGGEENDEDDVQLVGIARSGQAVRFSLESYTEPSTVKGRLFMRLGRGDEVVNVENCDGSELVALASRDGRALMFPVREISHVKGPAKGVRAITLEGKDQVLDFTLCRERLDGLEVETNRGAREIIRATKAQYAPSSRGNKGKLVIQRGHLIRAHRPPVEIIPGDEDEAGEEE
ncbi:DNA topoisomerase [Lujinxingia litoralis]|uniref:DNA topoisomerase (ATP-hydrolyzing) n=1 Tax=Lujinxingia litoralis TaxID=2211119 RepID=A0A328C2F2_9DELT|nr:DNA topoisomerase IV subunit A [Lujinxingia litoralis]RAL20604.1 DNA topoisomerase [Lujinxingia litoralis]